MKTEVEITVILKREMEINSHMFLLMQWVDNRNAQSTLNFLIAFTAAK